MINKSGIVLSGGGVKGVAHIAFIETLVKKRIAFNKISGSSSGALVGALYAAGHSSEEILSFFRQTPLFRVTWVSPTKPGIFDSEKYISIFEKFLPSTFEELELPLVIAATNLNQGRIEYFSEGDLYKPLLASCAVPLFFSPVDIDGQMYADGGIMDNFPVVPLQSTCDKIFGSYLTQPAEKNKKDLNSALKITNHANALLMQAANQYKILQTDATIIFELDRYGIFDTKRIDQIYESAKMYLKQKDNWPDAF